MEPVLGTGPIYFLAEAPGRHEDEVSHRPLTGPSGTLLQGVIQGILGGVGADNCSYDNVVNCRPPQNRTPVWNETEACRPRRWKYVEQAKPKLIVGLGAVPLHWALNSTDLSGMRGRVFAIKVGNHECWFMPTYHPSFILRTAFNKKKPLQSKLGHCFRMDIQRAFDVVDTLTPVHIDSEAEIRSGVECFDGSSSDHYGRLCALLDNAAKSSAVSVDLETVGLRPFQRSAAIVSVALSYEATNLSFAVTHPKESWTLQQRRELKSLCVRLLKQRTTRKIAHNAPFEIEWLTWWLGREAIDHASWECTQVQAHFIDERRGKQGGADDERRAPYQSLDFLCKQHFGFKFKSLFKVNKKDMSKSDLNEVLVYNAVDTKYTLKLWHVQNKILKERGLYAAYLEAVPRQPTVALMQTFGVDVDQKQVKRLQRKLDVKVTVIEQKISRLEDVPDGFNPLSTDEVFHLFKDKLKLPGIENVDKNTLSGIDHPLADLIITLRNKNKLKSTYVDTLELGHGEFVYPDGKIHTNFNTTFAETGRTSSDAPNMQNFPQRKDAWVRKQVVAPKNHVLVAFDYGQLEGCTSAICSGDQVLIKALWDDYDIHMEWARKVAAKYPDLGEADKKLRSIIKNKFVFPAIFGAQDASIAGYLNMPEDVISVLMKEFWNQFHGLKSWQDSLMQHYYDKGWVASPTGRRHHYPLTRNQAINHPIQSFACDIVCNAMNELSALASETGQWHLHPILNIHDDLTFAIPDDDQILEESIEQIYKIMLSPPYKCVNVPLSVAASFGPSWFGMKEIGKFWSHKDL